MLEEFLKSHPGIVLMRRAPAGTDGKLQWADDTKQWEVYRVAGRKIYYLYKGESLADALKELESFDLEVIVEKQGA